MQTAEIIEILSYWNFWSRKLDVGVYRKFYVEELVRQRKLKEASVVLGVRRSGKSTILLQVLKHLIDSGVPRKNTLYINFEEPSFDAHLNLDFLIKIYQAYLETFDPQGKIYIVLDEVHQVPQWEKFVRGLYDRNENVKFYLTGSSASLLSPEFGSVLTGRIYSNEVFPLDFIEFLEFQGKKSLLDSTISKGLSGLRYQFKRYLKFGGFPQVVLTKADRDKTQLLKDYYMAIIEKDIVQRYQVRDIKKLREFCLNLVTNIATTFSGYRTEKKLKISQPTANKFLEYTKDVYLVQEINYFAYSFARQKVNPTKIYAIDPGLYRAVSFRFSQNLGRIFENMVYLSLRRQQKEVFYWKNGHEVDFVVRDGTKISRIINVCWELNEENKQREIDGLKEAMSKFKLKGAELITMGYPENIMFNGKTIQIKNYLQMLAQSSV